MNIDQLNRKLAGIETKVDSLVRSSIKRHSKEIIKRNQEQLLKGEDSEGKLKTDEFNPYGSYKSKKWIEKRKAIGRQTNYVDLNFSGDFQKSMFVKFDALGFSLGLDATDKKKDILIHHWGETILGLNDANFEWLLDVITEDLYTGLNNYFR
jgi:hypothetical protein